jgi:malate synthase
LAGKAQIGKGMCAVPDQMLAQEIGQLECGTAPTAAGLHATRYHRVDVQACQAALMGSSRASFDKLLEIPLGRIEDWTEDEKQTELDNNAQGILGYIVRWVDQGIAAPRYPTSGTYPHGRPRYL